MVPGVFGDPTRLSAANQGLGRRTRCALAADGSATVAAVDGASLLSYLLVTGTLLPAGALFEAVVWVVVEEVAPHVSGPERRQSMAARVSSSSPWGLWSLMTRRQAKRLLLWVRIRERYR
jgi:hypothetical protein